MQISEGNGGKRYLRFGFFFFFFFFVSLLSYTSNDTTILAGEKTYRINSILPIVIDKFLPRTKLNFLRLGISMVLSNV